MAATQNTRTELAHHLKPVIHCGRLDNANRPMCGSNNRRANATNKIIKGAAEFVDCFYYRRCQTCVASIAKKAAKKR